MRKDVLIVAAMKMELPPIPGAVATGFGKEKTRRVLGEIIKTQRPSVVISVGLVGAVVPEMKVGDLFIPEAVMDFENPEKRFYPSLLPSPHRGEACEARVRGQEGILITVHKVFEREDKYELKKTIPDAWAVDMETSAVCEVLEPLGIPLLCIKAVSDELDFDFSDKTLLNENIKKAVNGYSEYLCRLLEQIRS